MEWIKALDEKDLSTGERRVLTLEGREILLIEAKGKLHAISNRCPHMGFPLRTGRIDEDCAIHCPLHHSAFKLDSGDVVAWSPWPPGLGVMLGKLSREKTLDIYPVKREGGAILVGVPEKVDAVPVS
jgi:nitrite reductase/ring-hydroxylating ferredoxin subunit